VSTPKILIKAATPADAQDLARLNAAFNGGSDPAERLAERLADPASVEQVLLAEVDGLVVGFAALRIVPCVLYADPHGELTELFVEQAYRRLGVGRELLSCAEKIARERDVRELVILTDETNHVSRSFYAAMGYESGEVAFSKGLSGSQADLKPGRNI
jgi:ribosomal protein S18 acetylase RimI-like enzyme